MLKSLTDSQLYELLGRENHFVTPIIVAKHDTVVREPDPNGHVSNPDKFIVRILIDATDENRQWLDNVITKTLKIHKEKIKAVEEWIEAVGELARVAEFSKSSKNSHETYETLRPILQKYALEHLL